MQGVLVPHAGTEREVSPVPGSWQRCQCEHGSCAPLGAPWSPLVALLPSLLHLFTELRLEVGCTTPDRYSWKSRCGVYWSCLGARASLGHWNEHACCCNTSFVAVVSVLALLPSLLTCAVGMRQAKVSGFLFEFSLFLTLWIKDTKKMQNILSSNIRRCCAAGAFSKMTYGLLGNPNSEVRGSSFLESRYLAPATCVPLRHIQERRKIISCSQNLG